MTTCLPRKSAKAQTLYFETPPFSTNAIWRSVNGRNIKSREYREWQKATGDELEAQTPPCVPGAISVRIKLSKKCRLDADNPIKSYLDLLTAHGVIEGDSKRFLKHVECEHSELETTQIQIISTTGGRELVQGAGNE